MKTKVCSNVSHITCTFEKTSATRSFRKSFVIIVVVIVDVLSFVMIAGLSHSAALRDILLLLLLLSFQCIFIPFAIWPFIPRFIHQIRLVILFWIFIRMPCSSYNFSLALFHSLSLRQYNRIWQKKKKRKKENIFAGTVKLRVCPKHSTTVCSLFLFHDEWTMAQMCFFLFSSFTIHKININVVASLNSSSSSSLLFSLLANFYGRNEWVEWVLTFDPILTKIISFQFFRILYAFPIGDFDYLWRNVLPQDSIHNWLCFFLWKFYAVTDVWLLHFDCLVFVPRLLPFRMINS